MFTPSHLYKRKELKEFFVTERDIQAVGEDILEPSDELSDEELELAAGGTVSFDVQALRAAIITLLFFLRL